MYRLKSSQLVQPGREKSFYFKSRKSANLTAFIINQILLNGLASHPTGRPIKKVEF